MKTGSRTRVKTLAVPTRATRSIFISHSHEDARWVPFLKALLELHNHRTWNVEADLDGGALFERKVEEAIRSCDALLVLVSGHAVGSKWITKEIAAFTALKPEAPAIPVLLEPVELRRVMPGLERYQAIDLSVDLLRGFRELFWTLGNDFLSKQELLDRRGARDDRRIRNDRRRTDAATRVKMGFVLTYCRETGSDGSEMLTASEKTWSELKLVLAGEAQRYEYLDRSDGLPVDPMDALERGMLGAWRRIGEGAEQEVGALLRAVAEEVCARHHVRVLERRETERRRPD